MLKAIGVVSVMTACVSMLGGCSHLQQLGVQPWERGILAKPEMQGDAMARAFDEHIYFSKEASSGGAGFAAGGCGCN
jgi:hypothetical protein